MTLDSSVIWITGAAQGIGQGTARAALEAGGRLLLTDLSADDVAETARRLDPEGSRTLAMAADVTDKAAVLAAVERGVERFGRLDGLVNNAGVLAMGSALHGAADDLSRQLEVNVHGVAICCRIAARQMIAQRSDDTAHGGAIVNVASNAGKVGYPNMAGYNASKAAVISLTRSLAAEWAQYRINVNAVCPGGVETPMLSEVAAWIAEREGGDPEQLLATMTPPQLGRHIQPVEVGRVVVFLLSRQADIIRGQAINVDGGDTPY
ncbi:MAG: SDR family NAD(P)-dependent oxidoreductase [Acidobacteriota bacterium]